MREPDSDQSASQGSRNPEAKVGLTGAESSLAVSIINYRTGPMTINSVKSVLDVLGDRSAEIIVVDNASGDGSDTEIEAWIARSGSERVRLIRSASNSGFSGGHNQGMAAAPGADFYLILNSDALLLPGFFEPLLAAAEADPDVGLIAPRLEWEDGRPQQNCFRFQGVTSELIRGARTGPISRLFRRKEVALELPPRPEEIEWVSFACVLLRGEMVRQIGPMDEGYFLYFEDAEYCLRARRAGWKTVYASEARAVHFRGGSGPVKAMTAEGKRLPAYYWRSRTRYLRQIAGPLGPLLGNLAWLAGRGIANLRLFAGRPIPKSNEGEWRDIWTNFLTPLAVTREDRK